MRIAITLLNILLAFAVGCRSTNKMISYSNSTPIEIRIYTIVLQSNVDFDVSIYNIRAIATRRDTIVDSPGFEGEAPLTPPISLTKEIADDFHNLRIIGSSKGHFELRGLCEIIYSDGTTEEFLIDKDGYIRYGDLILRDSYRILEVLGVVCLP